jgi:ABC-type polysaccharide/polyol phosphate export permease
MWLVFGTLFENMTFSDDVQKVVLTGKAPDFPVYLLSGQLIFGFFNESTSMAMESILIGSGLIKKVYIPKYIFPLEKIIFSLVNTFFSILSLVVIIIIMGAPVSPWALLSPVVIVLLFVFNLGVGLILSSLVVFFRDIKHLYGIFTLALTYLTPIFYSETIMYGNEIVLRIIRLNPMYWFVRLFRDLVVYGNPPEMRTWAICGGVSVLALFIGFFVLKKTQDKFILHI